MNTFSVQATIREFLERLGVVVEGIDEHKVGPQTIFRIRSGESGLLIGSGGETLRALNHLIRRLGERARAASDAPAEPLSFLVDVNGYHAKRIEELHQSARLLSERARLFRHDVEMPPMSPYERMIVHAFLAEDPDIATQSSGEGQFRRVVIRYGKLPKDSKPNE